MALALEMKRVYEEFMGVRFRKEGNEYDYHG
jgi:hypothetical protein